MGRTALVVAFVVAAAGLGTGEAHADDARWLASRSDRAARNAALPPPRVAPAPVRRVSPPLVSSDTRPVPLRPLVQTPQATRQAVAPRPTHSPPIVSSTTPLRAPVARPTAAYVPSRPAPPRVVHAPTPPAWQRTAATSRAHASVPPPPPAPPSAYPYTRTLTVPPVADMFARPAQPPVRRVLTADCVGGT